MSKIKINDEWEIEDDFLTGKGFYHIHKDRLMESYNADSRRGYDWPVQIGKKPPFDYDKFVEAYRAALAHFGSSYKQAVDLEKLEYSVALGKTYADRRVAWAKRSSHTTGAPANVIDAVRRSEMDPEQNQFNSLMD